jgi:hypothetical protein
MKCGHCHQSGKTLQHVRECSGTARIPEVSGTRPEPRYLGNSAWGVQAREFLAEQQQQDPSEFLGLNKEEGPTQKQLDYAHSLLRDRQPYGAVLDAENTGGSNSAHEVLNSMSKKALSEFIDKMLTRPRRDSQSARTSTILVDEGFYLHNDQYYKVQRAVHGSGHLYAKRWVVPTGGGGEPFWEMAAGAVSALRPEEELTREQAAEFGHLYGVCVRCGRTLTDEASIAAGIGPICAGKAGWM